MYTAPNANPAVSPKEGIMAWFRGAERWLDDRGRKAWIITMIVAFIFAWPIGLALLAYLIWSKRMFNRSCGPSAGRGGSWARHNRHPFGSTSRPTGNAAFDTYKAETLRRLQDEQEAFEAFLQRLRNAKDATEFDTFMADRAKANATASAGDASTTPSGADTARSGAY